MAHKKTLLTGLQPSGRPHVGNYFGAMKQVVDLQDDYRSYFMIVDYHALTTVKDPEKLSRYIIDAAIDYLAIGLDAGKVAIFKQSDVPLHAELAWIFECLTSMPYLMRSHAYKDAEAKNKEINAGVFNYPMLMAADILLYDADIVPVGEDQRQHVEIARDTAEKFNRVYGKTFTVPEEKILADVAVVPGIDGRKMSKSYDNGIPLFAEEGEINKLVMQIVTDSKGVVEAKDPDRCTLFALHKLFSAERIDELEKRYRAGTIGYHESKKLLAENMNRFIAPLREKRKSIAEDKSAVLAMLREGGEHAKKRAEEKMNVVRKRIGVSLY